MKIALITGSSRGIGAATARRFAKAGFAVCINYKKDRLAAESILEEVLQLGSQGIAVQADVSKSEEVNQLFSQMDTRLPGKLRVLVNNAGILKKQSRVVDMNASRIQEVLTTNILSAFLCSQQAILRMSAEQGGAIVNVSSAASRLGSANEYVDYAASKGAIDSLTIGLSKEVAAEGIRVNGVRPGFINTEMHASGGEANRIDRVKPTIPLKRGGQTEEVADAIFWLASEESAFVTGALLDIAGGV